MRIVSKTNVTRIAAACLFLFGAVTTHAAVTTVALYELEGAAGNTAPLPVDSSSNNNDFNGGAVSASSLTYSSDTPIGIGSSTSVDFATYPAGYYWTVAALPQDNLGFEIWAKTTQSVAFNAPDSTGNPATGQAVHLIGNSSNDSGIEIGTVGTSYYAAISNVAFVGFSTIADNVWTHLALVRDNGTASFYVNGALVASSVAVPNAVTENGGANAHFGVSAGGFTGYQGLADQARFFSFNAGEFQVSDLNYVVQLVPAPAALPAGLILLGAMAIQRRRK